VNKEFKTCCGKPTRKEENYITCDVCDKTIYTGDHKIHREPKPQKRDHKSYKN